MGVARGLSIPRTGFSIGAAPNKAGQWLVYTFGGGGEQECTRQSAMSYNVATDRWGDSFVDGFVGFSYMNGAAKLGARIYTTGGGYDCDGSFQVSPATWAYEPATNRLLQRADMPRATKYGTSGVIGGKLFVLAGYCTGEASNPAHCAVTGPVRQFYRYDAAANTWLSRRQPPHLHTMGASGVLGDKLYLVGGWQGRDLDVYDPATNTWQTLAPFPVTHERYFAAALQSELFVVGWSWPSGASGPTLNAYAYNPATNKWRVRAKPPIAGNGFVRVVLDGQSRLFLPGRPASYLYTP